MTIKYKYDGQIYTLPQLRKVLPHISIPNKPTKEQLEFIGVEEYVEETPLSIIKERKILELKMERDTLEVEPIEYNGNMFDFDDKARDRINGAIIALEMQPTATLEWTLADNTSAIVAATDLKGVIASAAVRSNALHVAYRNAKLLVETATTKEEVEAIVLK